MKKNKTMPRYSELFKKNALDMVFNCGYSVHKAASLVGIGAGTLYRWKSKKEIDDIKSNVINYKNSIPEIIQLREENKKLAKQNQILKRTMLILSEN